MNNTISKLVVVTNKIVLSSENVLYKTENFVKETKYISCIDSFISKISECLLLNVLNNFKNKKQEFDEVNCYKISIKNLDLSFLLKVGYQLENVSKLDFVFFEMLQSKTEIKQNDQRIVNFLKSNNSFEIELNEYKRLVKKQEFVKLYLISNKSGINLPKLDGEQKNIVETVDKNMLVQGVAGSGKTNVCIDKIIFSACRNYTNRLLYTTFSRGLLNDTKIRIENYVLELEDFVEKYENREVVFIDNNHKKALENKLGIFFFSEDDDKVIGKIKSVISYLKTKVDYFLIQDLYKSVFGISLPFVSEQYFINDYVKNIKNHQITSCLQKLNKYSNEIIYKEIFGIINGFCDINNPIKKIDLQTYIKLRKDSFSSKDCENIYLIALDYAKHLENNNLCDNNFASRKMIEIVNQIQKYAITIVDEVQDYSQITLYLLSKISIKMFCVGDALQMINPSYFNFAYLKNLLFEDNYSSVCELNNNYRNTKKIAEIVNDLTEINKSTFGVHNFVKNSGSIDNGIKTNAVYCNENEFINLVQKSSFDNFTFVVDSIKEKENLKKKIKNQEVLTVSEIKGLERNTIVAYNLLSQNLDKWNHLKNMLVNRKLADENSVYRYYYNLFYVGISRAQQNLFVIENEKIDRFNKFFENNFKNLSAKDSIAVLNQIVSKIEFTQDELIERIKEFIKLDQFENARFIANKIKDDIIKKQQLDIIDVNEEFIQYGKYREAGVKFWELGMIEDAKKQFIISGDEKIISLIDACSEGTSSKLNIDILDYLCDVSDNEVASKFIIETMKRDLESLKNGFKNVKQRLKGK